MNSNSNKRTSVAADKYLGLLHENYKPRGQLDCLIAIGWRQKGDRQGQHREQEIKIRTMESASRTTPTSRLELPVVSAINSSEISSWRRLTTTSGKREESYRRIEHCKGRQITRRRRGTRRVAEETSIRPKSPCSFVASTICASLLVVMLATIQSETRDLSQLTFMPPQQMQLQQQLNQHQAQLQLAASIPAALQERCKMGAPLQWRPYLDASSKAYLAPVVALATLEHFTLAPIQLVTGASLRTPKGQTLVVSDLRLHQAPNPSLAQHAQSVNNVGVLIEATFQVRSVLRRSTRGPDLHAGRLLSLHYKVSASLATTSDIIALANSMEQTNQTRSSMTGGRCALELDESELSKKGGELFKVGRDYVLFLEPAANVARKWLNAPRQQQVGAGAAASFQDQWWLPFASHEPVSNQTSRLVNRVLCKNCVRPPSVRLVNSTFLSVATTQQQQHDSQTRRRIKLDCRVSGNPAPWVEWFRNGKLLRNRSSLGRWRIKTGPWKGRPNERLSRLELELATGRNETGVYECRAMSVAAREPAVGTYTLLVLPAQFALFPMQQTGGGGGGGSGGPKANELDEQQRREGGRGQKSATKTNKTEQARADASQTLGSRIGPGVQSSSDAAGASDWATGSTSTTSAPPQQQQQAGAASNSHRPAAEEATRDEPNQSDATGTHQQQQQNSATSKSSPVVVGQPCPREAHDNFCLNRGTCVLIGHIEEYFCNCAEGYHGHRCEYKSLGHQQNSH